MSSANKAKGTRFETAIVDYLNERGVHARRLPRAGANDIGDVELHLGPTTLTLEAKATKAIDLAQFVHEANVEAGNYARKFGGENVYGVAVVKRRMKGTGQAYAVMELDEFVSLVMGLANGG